MSDRPGPVGEERPTNSENPRYWFRAKRYAWGWGLPLAWQGWAFLVAWIIALPLGHRLLPPGDKPMRWGFMAAMIVLLIAVCYWKGDPLGRRWNKAGGN